MTDLEKRADEYADKRAVAYNMPKSSFVIPLLKVAYKTGATQETALLSQHILDLQKDKGNLTDRVRELEQENEQIKNSDTLCKLIGEQKRKIAELEDKLANADYQLEGRDIKIKELEHQLTHRNCLDCSNHSSNLRMRTLELEKEIAELEAQIEKMKCLLNEIYSEYGFSELLKIRNDLPLEIQEVTKEIKEK